MILNLEILLKAVSYNSVSINFSIDKILILGLRADVPVLKVAVDVTEIKHLKATILSEKTRT